MFESKAEERSVVAAARRGEPEARQRVVELLIPDLDAGIARRAGASLQRATTTSDLRQEILTSLLKALHHLRDDADLEDVRALAHQHTGWVLARHGRRAGGFEGESALHVDGLGSVEPAAQEPTTGPVTAKDQQRWLAERIDRLDPDQAAVVRLRIQGMDFDAISRALGIRADTARKRNERAMKRLLEP